MIDRVSYLYWRLKNTHRAAKLNANLLATVNAQPVEFSPLEIRDVANDSLFYIYAIEQLDFWLYLDNFLQTAEQKRFWMKKMSTRLDAHRRQLIKIISAKSIGSKVESKIEFRKNMEEVLSRYYFRSLIPYAPVHTPIEWMHMLQKKLKIDDDLARKTVSVGLSTTIAIVLRDAGLTPHDSGKKGEMFSWLQTLYEALAEVFGLEKPQFESKTGVIDAFIENQVEALSGFRDAWRQYSRENGYSGDQALPELTKFVLQMQEELMDDMIKSRGAVNRQFIEINQSTEVAQAIARKLLNEWA